MPGHVSVSRFVVDACGGPRGCYREIMAGLPVSIELPAVTVPSRHLQLGDLVGWRLRCALDAKAGSLGLNNEALALEITERLSGGIGTNPQLLACLPDA